MVAKHLWDESERWQIIGLRRPRSSTERKWGALAHWGQHQLEQHPGGRDGKDGLACDALIFLKIDQVTNQGGRETTTDKSWDITSALLVWPQVNIFQSHKAYHIYTLSSNSNDSLSYTWCVAIIHIWYIMPNGTHERIKKLAMPSL